MMLNGGKLNLLKETSSDVPINRCIFIGIELDKNVKIPDPTPSIFKRFWQWKWYVIISIQD